MGFEVIVGEADFGFWLLKGDSVGRGFGVSRNGLCSEAKLLFVSGRVPGAKCQKDKQENINPRHFSTFSAFNVFTT